ncbi:MAG TPA: AAA-like domain-containing protein [Blastocatellia bacterium]|nr:AAA-like domain-containing protein [Blastocatellia bacterium]
MSQSRIPCYEFGPFRLDAAKCLLLREGQVVPLKAKAMETLLALVERRGAVVGKEELMQCIWPDSVVEEGNLSVQIFALRRALGESPEEHRYIVTMPGRGYRFVASVREVTGAEMAATVAVSPRHEELEPIGGAMPLDSRFYVERQPDVEFQTAIARRASIVLVKGARQVGKTSLLARSLQQAREAGARVVLNDLQMLNAAQLTAVEPLLRMLAKALAEQLELAVSPDQDWDPDLGPNMNFTRYLRREVLEQSRAPLVWGLDEVDRLFTCSFGGEVFGLFRSWHNARSLDPGGPWLRLTLAMAYATEAHLFITDVHQSPFNVGTRLTLEDFTLEQVAELNRRYGSPLRGEEVAPYYQLVGGHPYLVRCGLQELVTHQRSFAELAVIADDEDGPFGDHLRRLAASLEQDKDLGEVVRGILQQQPCPTQESFYRLRSAGLMIGDSAREARPRCQLYATYLAKRLL